MARDDLCDERGLWKAICRGTSLDLRHVRWPFCYELGETATQETRTDPAKGVDRATGERASRIFGTIPAALKRAPLTELREWAIAAGWCGDIQSATIGDNDWRTFAILLRQAAADGTLPFWGRRYMSDFSKDLDTEPLVEIPKAHFADFEFDPTALARSDSYDLFTAGSATVRALGRARYSATFTSMPTKPVRG